jgi:hypothetical protein
MPWFRGCTHAHTDRSDGDSPPVETALWYKRAGYDFLAICDHDGQTRLTEEERKELEDGSFVLVPGEEVTGPAHVNALFARRAIGPPKENDVASLLKGAVRRILAAGGLPQLNHPNFEWAYTDREMLATPDWQLFELYNAHYMCRADGDERHLSVEAYWDRILTTGRQAYAVASDDTHHLTMWGPHAANPARGWIMVWAEKLTLSALRKAMEQGRFYASCGVFLDNLIPDNQGLYVRAAHPADFHFIGDEGRPLLTAYGVEEAAYHFQGDERYVRCRVQGEGRMRAWTQAVFRPIKRGAKRGK